MGGMGHSRHSRPARLTKRFVPVLVRGSVVDPYLACRAFELCRVGLGMISPTGW